MTQTPTPAPKARKPDELATLRARARKAGADSRVGIAVTTRISKATYKDLVELAEEYHTPFTQMTRQVIEDGIRAYRTPTNLRRAPGQVFRDVPELLAANPLPALGDRSPTRISDLARRAKADAMAAPVEPPDEIVFPDYVDKAMAKIPPGAMLPSAPALSEMPDYSEVLEMEPGSEEEE